MKSIKELLARKRDGGAWTTEEMTSFVDGVVHGSVTTPQAAAFLMASCIHGLDNAETAALTTAMTQSGVVLQHQQSSRKRIDKHSTGGVGDKVSLLVTPLAVACGMDVPMISGRGLGHTGGTVDKLESILGFQTSISVPEQLRLLEHHHAFMIGQSAEIAPADKILYALRDATGTVENTGLITASILSKKLAEGIDGLVLDVKVGSAAFMKSFDQAKVLAQSMKDVGAAAGLPIAAIFSHMNTILGHTAGNWVEVREAERALMHRASAATDLVEITTELVAMMLVLADEKMSSIDARKAVQNVWDSGYGHSEFLAMIERQGGRWHESVQHYDHATHTIELRADTNGYMLPLDGMSVALHVLHAGGGRKRETDTIDHAVGVEVLVDKHARIRLGDPVVRVTAIRKETCAELAARIQSLIKIETAPQHEEPSIIIQLWN